MRLFRPTLYDRLGVPPSAGPAELRQAYHAALRLVHPDLATDASDRIRRERLTKALNEAYAILSDSRSRAAYDASIRWRILLGRIALADRQPTIPSITLPTDRAASVVDRWRLFLWRTRLGQWLLFGVVLVFVVVAPRSGVESGLIALAVIAITFLVLAMDGEPTPMTDAAQLTIKFTRSIQAQLRASLVNLGQIAHTTADSSQPVPPSLVARLGGDPGRRRAGDSPRAAPSSPKQRSRST